VKQLPLDEETPHREPMDSLFYVEESQNNNKASTHYIGIPFHLHSAIAFTNHSL